MRLKSGVCLSISLAPLVQAVSTWTAADGIEACRRGCGGHGFSALSGLPNMFASYVQNVTWEGDNNVLCLQVSRPGCCCKFASCNPHLNACISIRKLVVMGRYHLSDC